MSILDKYDKVGNIHYIKKSKSENVILLAYQGSDFSKKFTLKPDVVKNIFKWVIDNTDILNEE